MKKLIIILGILLLTSPVFACEILVIADLGKTYKWQKGEPLVIRDESHVWGTGEVPPNFVIVRITDATVEQARHYLERWNKTFEFDILQDEPTGYRIRVKVDPALVSAGGDNNTLRADLKDFIVDEYGASIVSHSTTEAVLDVPKPINLADAKYDLYDRFGDIFRKRRYYFTEADVDTAIANGGIIELTKSQVLARIKNRLDE